MDAQDSQAWLGLAEDGVRKALALGAEEAEVFITSSAGLDVDIEENRLQGSTMDGSQGGAIRLLKDGRLGFAYFTQIGEMQGAMEKALKLSRLAPNKGFSLPEPGHAVNLPDVWSEDLASLDASLAIDTSKEFLANLLDELPETIVSGGVGLGWGAEAIASSRGVARHGRSTHASLGASLVLPEGETAINLWDSRSAWTEMPEVDALAKSLTQTAKDLRNPQPAKEGRQDVLFLHTCAGSLLGSIVGGAVIGDDALRGESVWSDAMDQSVADARLSIYDDPHDPQSLGMASYDDEGVATQVTPLIENGILRNFVFDAWDAHKHGRQTTGHAARGGFKGQPGTSLHHLRLEHDVQKPVSDLIAEMDAGVVVESMLGAHTANATTGDFSVTAPNVWRVEQGEIVHASQKVAIGGNLPKMLKDLGGMTKEVRRSSGATMPGLWFHDVAVSA